MKKYLFSIVVVTLMAGTLMADWEFSDGHSERKDESYNWPAEYVFMDVCVIPVEMDIGFWVKIVKCQDKKIELQQTKIHEYSGCVDVEVQTNVNVEFKVAIAKVEQEGIGVKVPGDYSASVNPSTLDAPGGTITVCAKIVKADLTKLPGGTNNVHVANVTLKVRPRVTPKLTA